MHPGPLTIAHISSEMAPFAKVGGLGDVVGSLAGEQARRGHHVTVVLPAYQSLELPAGWVREPLARSDVPWGMGVEPAQFERAEPRFAAAGAGSLQVLLVHHAGPRHFFERPGIYDEPRSSQGYPDNAERFLFFARAALAGLDRLGRRIDVLHAHDHQAAWAPCFVRTLESDRAVFENVATVFTIHNLGYQGIHDAWVLGLAGFPRELFYPTGPFEFWGRVNYMKVGIAFADLISTVSPRYAQEIQSSDEYGLGLEGVLRRRSEDLRGILNGIDDVTWNPASDPHLPHHYDADHLEGKARDREALLAACGFPARPDRPVVGMVTRLADQKGLDLIEAAAGELTALDARYIVLGAGQARYQDFLQALADRHPERVHFRAGFDERFAHLIEAGADLFLMPSRYEPCGLNQMYSMRYGTPPVVRETGGLADTVEEFDRATGEGTGFRFREYAPAEMLAALRRALALFPQTERWRILQRNGMAKDFSWRRSADAYDRLYVDAREQVAGGRIPTLDSVRTAI